MVAHWHGEEHGLVSCRKLINRRGAAGYGFGEESEVLGQKTSD